MIKSIRLKNFFSFKDQTIEFNQGMNILIGINGSGKSNVIKALTLLRESTAGMGFRKLFLNKWGGFDRVVYAGNKDNDEPIVLEYVFDRSSLKPFRFENDEYLKYSIEIRKHAGSNYEINERFERSESENFIDSIEYSPDSKTVTERFPEIVIENRESHNKQESALVQNQFSLPIILHGLPKAIKNVVIYESFDTSPNSEMKKPMLATSEKRLAKLGANLPQTLNTIKINDKNSYKKIIESLKAVNPHFSNIDFNLIGGNIELMLEEKDFDRSIHVTHISEGTLRYLCLMAIIYNKERGRLITIEEPDLGLHPDMLREVSERLKEASKETQFLISTHSVKMLDYFHWTDVLVVEKDEDNSSIVTKYNEEDFGDWYKDYSLGKMWEEGDLGGKRW